MKMSGQAFENEVLRCLGIRERDPLDERVIDLIRELTLELTSCVNPQWVYGFWDCSVDLFTVSMEDLVIRSGSLAGHMKGCRRAALMALTLGSKADALVRRHSLGHMEKALIAHVVCTAMVEEYCRQVEGEIAPKGGAGKMIKRFSPGYGDFHISYQKDILNMLDCGRRIGLAMTEGHMLVPAKSVTAVIGFEFKYGEII